MSKPMLNKLVERRARIWDESGGVCFYCGRVMHPIREFTIDHRIPRSKGGGDDSENLVAACWNCNSKKRARIVLPPVELLEMTIQEAAELIGLEEREIRRMMQSPSWNGIGIAGRRKIVIVEAT